MEVLEKGSGAKDGFTTVRWETAVAGTVNGGATPFSVARGEVSTIDTKTAEAYIQAGYAIVVENEADAALRWLASQQVPVDIGKKSPYRKAAEAAGCVFAEKGKADKPKPKPE